MKRKKNKSVSPWRWRAEWLAHRSIEWVLAHLPASWVFHIGEMLGDLAWRFFKQRRMLAFRNLRIVMGEEHHVQEIEKMTREVFRRTGANLLSSVHTAKLPREELAKALLFENIELLENTYARGQGIVLLLAHMGNWEMLSRMNLFFPNPNDLAGLYRPLENHLINRDVLKRRSADGAQMFSKQESIHRLAGFLKQGGILGILADQHVGRGGLTMPLFGRLTKVSPLPSLLARRAKAEVIALSLSTVRPGVWKATFHPVKAQPTTQDCMEGLEHVMRQSLLDVFWLHDRWKLGSTKLRPLSKWLGDPTMRGSKPHRVLLGIGPLDSSREFSDEWFHPDLVWELLIVGNASVPAWFPNECNIHHIGEKASRDEWIQQVEAIDHGQPWPLDFILLDRQISHQSALAKATGIKVYQLD
ncbi:MAG: hypothetical protein EAZ42_04710 [Verrucomicrobia bacterium]|nr:MAG: hypothetical protein EAZ42_04710 [Verrucomicrobiota bacterium]